ncbi:MULTISPECIES: hypothetical protein [unclassified Methylophilus]|jgi:hypothetical protein|uniref:hypothetical protein n=1 Tax=unclassified Methylophilus TaxID=2630143 RepID=UPI0006FED089|nr:MULTISPECIES: hypothetical protein [unclassified Methylophilus]KQT43366.1 hypothetical protein ASG34_00765 [Methylophilus sp. Leaf416]KQT58851.1 hypothetical protein ASG44_00770 [Methylophilus sp. Leaf459]
MVKNRLRRPSAKPVDSAASWRWQDWKVMLPVTILTVVFLYWGLQHQWDVKMLAGVALLVGFVSGAFVWIVGLIGLLPVIGPIIVKVLSFGFIWLLNALGYLVSFIAIRRGYSKDVLTYRGLTVALMLGIVIGYVIAQFI